MIINHDGFAFDWQGHRGSRGLFPENTILAMQEALKFPITTLELDVVIDKNKQVIVSHEPWMAEEICLDPKGKSVKEKQHNIYKMTYEEISKFDCGSKIHPRFPQQKKVKTQKPKLIDLIAEIEKINKNISYNIEIKSTVEEEAAGFQPPHKEFTDIVISTLKPLLPESRFSIQSFDWRVLDFLSEKYPMVTRVALMDDHYEIKKLLKTLKVMPHVFSPYFQLVTKEDVIYLHAHKIKIIPWTVNSKEDFKKLKSLGVDGIITDYPNLIE